MKQGTLATYQRREPPAAPGPPFPLNSADNGLSVDPVTGRIVLGQSVGEPGNPAGLLNNREIPLNAFNLSMGITGTDVVAFNINAGNVPGDITGWSDVFQMGSITQPGSSLYYNETTGLYQFGAIGFGHGNGSRLEINDATGYVFINSDIAGQMLQLYPGGANDAYFQLGVGDTYFYLDESSQLSELWVDNFRALLVDVNNGIYRFGDFDNIVNGAFLSINDGTGLTQLRSATGGVADLLMNNTSTETRIGDVSANGNGTNVLITDNVRSVEIQQATRTGLDISFANQLYQLGDVNVIDGGMRFRVDDANLRVNVLNGAGLPFLDIDNTNFLYQFGDIFGASGNSVFLYIDSVNSLIIHNGDNYLHRSGTTLTNGAAANAGTLLNAPAAGNPTKWVPIDDNGTTRYIPAW